MYLLKDKDILLYVTNRNGNISIDKPLLFENKEDAEKLNAELGNNWIVTTKEEAVNKLKKRQIERSLNAVQMTDQELEKFWDRPFSVILKECQDAGWL